TAILPRHSVRRQPVRWSTGFSRRTSLSVGMPAVAPPPEGGTPTISTDAGSMRGRWGLPPIYGSTWGGCRVGRAVRGPGLTPFDPPYILRRDGRLLLRL